jgi:hypothetical protein
MLSLKDKIAAVLTIALLGIPIDHEEFLALIRLL